MARAGRYPLSFHATGQAVGKMRNEISIAWPDMKQAWTMATDEAPNLGGEDTAPPPLAFFMAALVGCAMTQVRMMARQMKVTVSDLRVTARADWVRDVPERGVHVADTTGYEIDIEIDSPNPPAEVEALIHASQKGCFVEHSLMTRSPIRHRLRHGQGDWIAADAPSP